jgi:hypothetical protein
LAYFDLEVDKGGSADEHRLLFVSKLKLVRLERAIHDTDEYINISSSTNTTAIKTSNTTTVIKSRANCPPIVLRNNVLFYKHSATFYSNFKIPAMLKK